jgi:hypothetical protein
MTLQIEMICRAICSNSANIALCARMQYGCFLEGALRAPSKKQPVLHSVENCYMSCICC